MRKSDCAFRAADPTAFILLVVLMLLLGRHVHRVQRRLHHAGALFAPIALAYQSDPVVLWLPARARGRHDDAAGRVLLFVMCGMTRISMAELVRHVWPFVALQYGVLLLCLAFPSLVTALPRALGY